MTREEFLTESRDWDWYELIDFCTEMDCPLCEDVYSEDDRDDYINDCLDDMFRHEDWRDVRDSLNNLLDDYDFYERDDYGDWYGLGDNDLADRIQDVLEWMDERDLWDEEEYDPWDEDEDETFEDEDCEDEEDTTPIEDEDIPITELLVACNKGLKSIGEKQAAEDKAFEENFIEFVAEVKIQTGVEGR